MRRDRKIYSKKALHYKDSSCFKVENKEPIDLRRIKAGSLVEIRCLENLGRDSKEIRNILRGIYSKKIVLKLNGSIFDFSCGVKEYFFLIDILSYIIERKAESVRIGIETARKKGKQIGRKKLSIEDLPQRFLNNYDAYKEGLITKVEFAEICSCSRPTLDTWIKCFESER